VPRPPLGILFNPSASSDALPGRITRAPWKDRPTSSYGGLHRCLRERYSAERCWADPDGVVAEFLALLRQPGLSREGMVSGPPANTAVVRGVSQLRIPSDLTAR
jgi:hypothetical protein